MSEWLNFVKEYSVKNNIPYKQALKDASPLYKKRHEVKTEPKSKNKNEVKSDEVIPKEKIKTTNKNTSKKVVENITLKL